MKLRQDVVDLLRAGLSDRVIARELHVDAKVVGAARAALGLPRTPSGPRPQTLEELFRARTEEVPGGHLRWTGCVSGGTAQVRHDGRLHTAHRIAFTIRTGRAPVGNALPACDMEGCVAPAHVDDRLGRESLSTAYDAIFGGVA
ncbi:hypothetical protein [Streptomyces lavendulae]|uniref:hypothetical protein n=1 Tax=Streptomyces lavendulae TaxID=1914 RepID=UPI0036EFAF24